MNTRGFSIVEILITVAVVSTLAAVVVFGYTPFQKNSAAVATNAALEQARSKLEAHNGLERDYPPNLAGVNYSAPEKVAITLYTNAPTIRVHSGLSADQNAQLLLNTCNAFMPIQEGSALYNTACAFAGNNFHIKGKVSSNTILKGPQIDRSEFNIDCDKGGDVLCAEATQQIIQQFEAQGGVWPIFVPKNQTTLPEPANVIPTDKATKYCLEGRYVDYSDIVFHMLSGDTKIYEGICPSDPELSYPAVS